MFKNHFLKTIKLVKYQTKYTLIEDTIRKGLDNKKNAKDKNVINLNEIKNFLKEIKSDSEFKEILNSKDVKKFLKEFCT